MESPSTDPRPASAKTNLKGNIFRDEARGPGKRPRISDALELLPILIVLRMDGIPGLRVNSCVEKILGWTNQDTKTDEFLEHLFAGQLTRREAVQFFQSSSHSWRAWKCRTKSGSPIDISWKTLYVGDGIHMALGVETSGLNKTRENALEVEKARAISLSRAKSELIANVSHEILNPLNSIMGFAEILENELEDNFYRGCASTIRENGRFLLEIMNDLMDVTLIERDRLPLLLEATNPWDIIRSIADLMQILARDKDLPLILERDENAPESIVTDPKRLRQILVNLVGNGIKFTETGSITIRLGGRTDGDPESFSIEVIDTGIGIKSTEIEKLFEAFVRGSNHQSAGAGMGLSICRKLSRHLQGELQLQSEVGKGSTFMLRLPVICEES